MQNEFQPLLGRLQAQLEADEQFSRAIADIDFLTPEEFIEECRDIFADLFDTAAAHWFGMLDTLYYSGKGWHPQFPGCAVVEQYAALQSCWIEDFSRAIIDVAKSPETKPEERDFLYFMLGVLCTGWHEMIRNLGTVRVKKRVG